MQGGITADSNSAEVAISACISVLLLRTIMSHHMIECQPVWWIVLLYPPDMHSWNSKRQCQNAGHARNLEGCTGLHTKPCEPPWSVKTVTIIWGVLCGCYLIAYYSYNCVAECRLASLPYSRYRTGHALFIWQVRPASSCMV